MNRLNIVSTVFFFGLAACSEPQLVQTESLVITSSNECVPTPPVGTYCFDVSDTPPDADACPGNIMIGYTTILNPICPIAGANWPGAKLFPATAPEELRHYCRYEWQGAPAAPNLAGIPSGPFDSLEPDCNVVSPLGHPYESLHAPKLEAAYLTQMDALSDYPSRVATNPTKVVVVDSSVDAPFPNPGTGRLEHGQVMGELIRKVACPVPGSAGCLAMVSTELGLPLVRGAMGGQVVDEATGGFLGSQSYLATAIYDGLVRVSGSNGAPQTIINLSLGWDSHWGGDYTGSNWDSLPAPIRAVHAALSVVNCQGALIVAAAGNKVGGPQTNVGPMYPAGWEQNSPPTPMECAQLFGGQFGPVSTSTSQPFLYAAGGVDGNDEALNGRREGGTPALVAPADHVATTQPAPVPGGYTASGVYSGTSVAAAGVSSVAAIAWSYFPAASPHDIMAQVHASGIGLGVPPEFCGPSGCLFEQSRVSACQTVADGCTARGIVCSLSCQSPDRQAKAAFTLNDFPFTPDAVLDFDPLATPLTIPQCGGDVLMPSNYTPEDPCPGQQYFTRYGVPFATPQPPIPICPECFVFRNDGVAVLGLGEDFGEELSQPTIVVKTATEELWYPLDIADEELVEGATFEVYDIDFSQAKNVTFEVVVDGKYSNYDPMFIID